MRVWIYSVMNRVMFLKNCSDRRHKVLWISDSYFYWLFLNCISNYMHLSNFKFLFFAIHKILHKSMIKNLIHLTTFELINVVYSLVSNNPNEIENFCYIHVLFILKSLFKTWVAISRVPFYQTMCRKILHTEIPGVVLQNGEAHFLAETKIRF